MSIAFICKLVGITCWNEKENLLINLQLLSMELTGKLPKSFKFYHSLQSLDLPDLSSNSLCFQEVEAFEAVGAIPSLTSSTASCKVEAFKTISAGYSKLLLYFYWQSSCSWCVRFAFNLKGLPYEYKPVNLPAGEQFSPARQCHMPEAASIISSSIQPLYMLSVLKYLTEKSGPEESLSWAQSNIDKGFFIHSPSGFTPYFSNLNKWSRRVLIDVSHSEFFKSEKMLCTSKSKKKSTLMGFLQLEYTSLFSNREKGKDRDIENGWARLKQNGVCGTHEAKEDGAGLDSKYLSFWVAALVARARTRNHGQTYQLNLELVMFGWMILVDFAMVGKWTWNNKDKSPNMEDKRMVERDKV
ncbi:hypothetical protein EV1_040086 [Malus domestica]